MKTDTVDRVSTAFTKVPVWLRKTEDRNILSLELSFIDMVWDKLVENAEEFLRWEEVKIWKSKEDGKKAEELIEKCYWLELFERPKARITRSWGLYLKKV